MLSVTLEQVLSWGPCYSDKKVAMLFAGRDSLTARDILTLDIPVEDRLWAVLREDMISAPVLHEFACWCAEQALALIPNPDPRSVVAIATKRAWLHGEATGEQLLAAGDAARDAAWDAAGDAAWAAGARDAQVEYLMKVVCNG